MRIAEGFQATASIDAVKLHDHTLAAELRLRVSFPMPAQDEHLPDRIEAHVHAAGLETQLGSVDGGWELLVEFWSRRAFRSWTCGPRSVIC